MTFDLYQKQAHSTAVYPHKDSTQTLSYCALGLAGEAGEVAGEVKKMIRNDDGVLTPERKEKIEKEMGDVLWYLAEMSTVLGINLNYVALKNLRKLHERKLEGTLKERK